VLEDSVDAVTSSHFFRLAPPELHWYGEVPREAKRLEHTEALERASNWVPQKSWDFKSPDHHLFVYELGARWWIVLFQRAGGQDPPKGAENWFIEAYAHDSSWGSNYFYWPADDCWRSCLYEFRGENYGRHPRRGASVNQ